MLKAMAHGTLYIFFTPRCDGAGKVAITFHFILQFTKKHILLKFEVLNLKFEGRIMV